ncbi:hypothetical protein [Stenotrophomonas sp. SG1]|uniref:hypothetical protein n=1 Tax=Stenotrophomonas sp. SG1 TaxID=2944932 RepID=UPI001658888E|nr:hypothetical protein [Stenotrophomonas sp. SG1]MBC9081064.1 hypothetical protein [Stenotrophomonas maltophilia]MBC9092321.1 hypothetical protein [Stenotrophomonas maltophilia]MBH1519126.1 hypothetical protein [Stenotrophomonas maltophilia]MCF3484211.1 hypothetical protein [Stenotrophomonas maltophilia]MCW8343374.1 hypothetical protein [Stenotrophomonas sp. SG1]
MSILNVLLRPDQLLVAVDTLAEDAQTGRKSSGAKLLLIPQHNVVLAARGSSQFFLRIYELSLQASFRADFTMEQLSRELGLVIDKLWPAYERAALEAGIEPNALASELVLGGWSSKASRIVATAYAKQSSAAPAVVQPLEGGLASPGQPLHGREGSFAPEAVLQASRIQAAWLNKTTGRQVSGGHVLAAVLRERQAVIYDLGPI